jgi:thioesterase domain-containing protein
VPISGLFAHPQLKSFAALIELPHRDAEHALAIREHGTERPLFLAHEGADEVVYAWALAPYIDTHIPIYALPAPPDGSARLRTVEGMAQRMVKMIRAVQPVGPYRIGGYSFGAILAYEIAAQLVGADEEVELLGLLDLQVFGTNDDVSLILPSEGNQNIKGEFLAVISDCAASAGVPEPVQKAIAELNESSHALEELFFHCKDKGWLPDIWTHSTPLQIERILAHILDMKKAPYFYSLLPGDVHLFVAQEENGASGLPDRFAALVPGIRLRSIPIQGTHRTIVQEPDVKELGLLLSHATQEVPKRKAIPSVSKSLISLGSQPSLTQDYDVPLICVPGAGERAACFTDLVSSFSTSRPVFAFEARGLDGNGVPHSAIEAAAKVYLKDLETVSPGGPVHLVGHLRGGWIAFEMALLLESAARDVLSLTLLDSEPPDDEIANHVSEYTLDEVISHCLKTAECLTGRIPMDLADLEGKGPADQRQILHRYLVESGVLTALSTQADLYGLLQTVGMGLRANYVPRRAHSGPVRLILAAESNDPQANHSEVEKIGSGWRRWASSVTQQRVPGNRITMLKQPHVRVLAEMIEETMNQHAHDNQRSKAHSARPA